MRKVLYVTFSQFLSSGLNDTSGTNLSYEVYAIALGIPHNSYKPNAKRVKMSFTCSKHVRLKTSMGCDMVKLILGKINYSF